jgi:hypothetical protein
MMFKNKYISIIKLVLTFMYPWCLLYPWPAQLPRLLPEPSATLGPRGRWERKGSKNSLNAKKSPQIAHAHVWVDSEEWN